MFIKTVQIEKFRSIISERISLENLTVFVGENDVGKSNVLKALNLFFNNETSPGEPFNFENDYSRFAPERWKKAKEIKITLELESPPSYKDTRRITWSKVWRKRGLRPDLESRKYGNDKRPPARSKVNFWINNLSFKYIPAVKGKQYFSSLLEDLHDVLSMTVRDEVKNASGEFIHMIRKHTQQITKDLQKELDLSSHLQLPEDLSQLFKILDFETGIGNNQNISLDCRGDGIQSRHIPIVLKFIAEQSNMLVRRSNRDVIWGYEEPENNLEMSYAYELADSFSKYSKFIQILLTTHSPAFYSVDKEHSMLYYITRVKDANNVSQSQIERIYNTDLPDNSMGLMHAVAPFIRKKNEEIMAYRKWIEENQPTDTPTIFVEGDFDKKIIDTCISKMFCGPRVPVKSADGVDCVWKKVAGGRHFGFKSKLLGLVDADDAGRSANDKWKEMFPDGNNEKYRLRVLPIPEYVQKIKGRGLNNIPVELESFFPSDYWKYAKEKDWIEPNDRIGGVIEGIRMDVEQLQEIHRLIANQFRLNEHEKILTLYRLKIGSKEKFAKYAAGRILNEGIPDSLKSLIDEILEFFSRS